MAELPVVDPEITQEETNFSELFQVILQKIMNMKNVRESDVAHAISSMIKDYKRYAFPDMKKWENVCAYLFRYASHGAGLTRDRVLQAVRESEDLASCLENRDLRIVSLGGGPGNDIVGLCSVLHKLGVRNRDLSITVVDFYEEWSTCVTLVSQLVTEGAFGNVSNLFLSNDVEMSFLKVNLPGDPVRDENYFHLLQNADVILMVKLISGKFRQNLESVVGLNQSLKENMKDGALVLYIDSPIMPKVEEDFHVLFQSNLENYRKSSEIYEKFNSNDDVESKAQIAVLRKI